MTNLRRAAGARIDGGLARAVPLRPRSRCVRGSAPRTFCGLQSIASDGLGGHSTAGDTVTLLERDKGNLGLARPVGVPAASQRNVGQVLERRREYAQASVTRRQPTVPEPARSACSRARQVDSRWHTDGAIFAHFAAVGSDRALVVITR